MPALSPQASDAKRRAELDFWTGMAAQLTRECSTDDERRAALLRVCHEHAFPRYLRDLYLEPGSFDGLRVLDVGCGPHGGLIGFTGADRHGVDHLIDEYRALGYPLEAHGVRYHRAAAETLPFDDETFDVVVSVNALDHVDDIEQTMRAIGRVLRRGGRLLAQVNFHERPTPAEPLCLTHAQMAELLAAAGLTVSAVLFQARLERPREDRYYYEARRGAADGRLRVEAGPWPPPPKRGWRDLFRRRLFNTKDT